MDLAVAVAGGILIGLLLGVLGAGGSVLAVPVLVLGLGLGAYEATSGSLVVVGVTAAVAAVASRRRGAVAVDRGLLFAAAAAAGTVAGAALSGRVAEAVLLLAFAVLLVVAAAAMLLGRRPEPSTRGPVLSFNPLRCDCPRALKIAVAATVVGLLTGFLGVGGGFLVVPALVLALGLDLRTAAGTSLLVIAVTSAIALATRLAGDATVPWGPSLTVTAAALVAAVAGTQVAARLPARALQRGFAALLLAVAVTTAWQAAPALT
ncbi:TSUP family transporter [Nocardioides coralli]|uniref:TSUP family transporter n=1 Tax=Nocardioides coralli TaxID=2872154 RepID=UPI001CA3A978|nr:TSUP family transporter [Nocardioides coralli]QZY29620.1 TSUP family transporter [Nocardioides coralli]